MNKSDNLASVSHVSVGQSKSLYFTWLQHTIAKQSIDSSGIVSVYPHYSMSQPESQSRVALIIFQDHLVFRSAADCLCFPTFFKDSQWD